MPVSSPRLRRTPTLARASASVLAIALLAGCGDDLESRNAALADFEAPADAGMTVQARAPAATGAEAPPPEDPAIDDVNEEAPVNADGEDLLDSAQGFAAAPMDSAAGFDPTPTREPAFGAAPAAAEDFGD